MFAQLISSVGVVQHDAVLTLNGDLLNVPRYASCDFEFDEFLTKFDGENSTLRRKIFCNNLDEINQHNLLNVAKHGYFMKIGPHADRAEGEVKPGGRAAVDFVPPSWVANHTDMVEDVGLMMQQTDWRPRMPAIKNQKCVVSWIRPHAVLLCPDSNACNESYG